MKRLIPVLLLLIFLPLLSVAATSNQTVTVRPGDVLAIHLAGEKALNGDFAINENGRIFLPEAGSLDIAGMSLNKATTTIRSALAKSYKNIDKLDITLAERKMIVTVLGKVNKPGKITLPANANIQMAISEAGGLAKDASYQMRLIHNNHATPFDYDSYLKTGKVNTLPKLTSMDTVFIPGKASESVVRVVGAVKTPGSFEWSKNMSLLDVLSQAGGITERADQADIKIVRKNKSSIKFNLEEFIQKGGSTSDIPTMQPGYTVVVPQSSTLGENPKISWTKLRSKNSIYLFGQVGAPGRYKFNRSMSFLDILSAANGPTTDADIRNITIINRNSRRPSIKHINLALYFSTGDRALLPNVVPGDIIYVPSRQRSWLENSPQNTIRVLGAVGKPGRYQFSDNMTILDLLAEAGGPTNNAYLKRVIVINTSQHQQKAHSFNMMAFVKSGNPALLPVLRAGDTVFVPDLREHGWDKFFRKLNDISSLLVILKVAGVITG